MWGHFERRHMGRWRKTLDCLLHCCCSVRVFFCMAISFPWGGHRAALLQPQRGPDALNPGDAHTCASSGLLVLSMSSAYESSLVSMHCSRYR